MKINMTKKDINVQITSSPQDYTTNTTDLALNVLDKLMDYNPDSSVEQVSIPRFDDLVDELMPEIHNNIEPSGKFETEQIFSPDKEDKPVQPEAKPKKDDTATRRLVFLRCPHCGDTFCTMLPFDLTGPKLLECLADIVTCAKCETKIPTKFMHYYRGSYTCECGAKGFFVMPEDVDIVKCKDCDHKFYMIFDPETNRYNGVPVPQEEVL